jgi:ubiquinone/menaquinone biosynthesis C-methylase UbiE
VKEIYEFSFNKTSDDHFTAELNDVLDRFGIEQNIDNNKYILDYHHYFNYDYDICYERHYIEDCLNSNAVIFRNVRFKNIGRSVWTSKGEMPLHISYHWLDSKGNYILWDGERTAFPIVIKPGRSVTLPLKIKTPASPGYHILQLSLVHEGVRWIDERVYNIPVRLHESIAPSSASSSAYFSKKAENITITTNVYDYEHSHVDGRNLLHRFLSQSYNLNGQFRLLEIGGGTSPQTAAFMDFAEIVNIDISLVELMLGSLYYAHHFADSHKKLSFACCDANKLPFVKGSFDGVVMFSTLHHFPEPEKLLNKVSGLIKRDGFIAILCEPVGSDVNDKNYLRDLEKGINEQIFCLEEYLQIFNKAGLRVIMGQLDTNDFKVILAKDQ